jgi:uncharacterized repeat protein (TIGR03803 family)
MICQSTFHRPSGVNLVACAATCVLTVCPPAAAQSLETLVHFQCSTLGCAPNGPLIQARDGYFYGTTSEADIAGSGEGTLFRMDRTGGIAVLSPARSFFEAADGFFYGTTPSGGTFDAGTVYRMDGTGAVTELYSFDGVTARSPGPLVEASDGSFYGIVAIPETDDIRLFRMSRDRNVTLLRSPGEAVRYVRMILSARNHFLYGTTYDGRVFRMNRKGQTRVLHSFPTVYVDLMEASDGFFYGVTIDGGASGAGMIFRMTRSGKVQVLHSFDGADGGANPYEAPIEGNDGYLYGTTHGGGEFDLGTVYRMNRRGTVTILHSFGDSADAGTNPVGELVQGDDGALYGTTVRGGESDQGTLFRLRLDDDCAHADAFSRGRRPLCRATSPRRYDSDSVFSPAGAARGISAKQGALRGSWI